MPLADPSETPSKRVPTAEFVLENGECPYRQFSNQSVKSGDDRRVDSLTRADARKENEMLPVNERMALDIIVIALTIAALGLTIRFAVSEYRRGAPKKPKTAVKPDAKPFRYDRKGS